MMNALFPDIDWSIVKWAGFDLDGTLYDEFEFISSVYSEITSSLITPAKRSMINDFMLKRWMEKGSSYPKIFIETQQFFSLKETFETDALRIFRNYKPLLSLPKRNRFILNDLFIHDIVIFLITDGHAQLQNNKIDALGIRQFFSYVCITGDKPKPDPFWGMKIQEKFGFSGKDVVFFGDRDVDRLFAKEMNFQFIKYKMYE